MMNERIISQNDKVVLKNLYSSGQSLHIFTLYRRCKLTPSATIKILHKLQNVNFVIMTEKTVKLTQNGCEWIVKNRSDFYSKKSWRKCPEKFEAHTHPSELPIAPQIKLVDERVFKKKKKFLPKTRLKVINQFRVEIDND